MRKTSISAVLAIAVLSAMRAHAQGEPNILEFSFSNPGARSLGLGGAFAALADDATAAFANPAGLVQLLQVEFSIEGHFRSFSSPFTLGGRVSGQPTGIFLDTSPGLRFGSSDEDIGSVSFLSFALPGERWSLAFYRHEQAKFKSASETQGLFGSVPGSEGVERFPDLRELTDFEVVHYGVAGAVRLGDRLSVGAGLSYVQARLERTTRIFFPDALTFPSSLGRTSFLPEREFLMLEANIDDSAWAANVGFLWRPDDRWSIGGFYRGGAEVELLTVGRFGPMGDPELVDESDFSPASDPVGLPDVWGFGAAFRSGQSMTLSFEWDRIHYSDIIDSLSAMTLTQEDFRLRDVSELHFGFEYVFLSLTPVVAARAGIWLDRSTGSATSEMTPSCVPFAPRGKMSSTNAFGMGMVFTRFQIDFAAELSAFVDTISLSLIYSF